MHLGKIKTNRNVDCLKLPQNWRSSRWKGILWNQNWSIWKTLRQTSKEFRPRILKRGPRSRRSSRREINWIRNYRIASSRLPVSETKWRRWRDLWNIRKGTWGKSWVRCHSDWKVGSEFRNNVFVYSDNSVYTLCLHHPIVSCDSIIILTFLSLYYSWVEHLLCNNIDKKHWVIITGYILIRYCLSMGISYWKTNYSVDAK